MKALALKSDRRTIEVSRDAIHLWSLAASYMTGTPYWRMGNIDKEDIKTLQRNGWRLVPVDFKERK